MSSEYVLDLGVAMLQTSSQLKSIPRARKAAIIESIRFLRGSDFSGDQKRERMVGIFLDVVSGSPYLTDEQRSGLTELVLSQDWETIARQIGCKREKIDRAVHRNKRSKAQLKDFQSMVWLLFRTSRKFARLPIERKRVLGGAILAIESQEQLVDLFLRGLSDATTLDNDTRMLIANDVFEGQFYSVLLPDRLDCDEKPRQYSVDPSAPPSQQGDGLQDEEPHEEECAICLDFLSSDNVCLEACSHSFCRPCLEGWFATYSQSRRSTCPLCRQDASIPQPHSHLAASQGVSQEGEAPDTTVSPRTNHFSFRRRRRHNDGVL